MMNRWNTVLASAGVLAVCSVILALWYKREYDIQCLSGEERWKSEAFHTQEVELQKQAGLSLKYNYPDDKDIVKDAYVEIHYGTGNGYRLTCVSNPLLAARIAEAVWFPDADEGIVHGRPLIVRLCRNLWIVSNRKAVNEAWPYTEIDRNNGCIVKHCWLKSPAVNCMRVGKQKSGGGICKKS